MEALHFGKGKNDPHRPPTPTVHIDTTKFIERFPSEVVYTSTTVSFEHQVQEGKHQ